MDWHSRYVLSWRLSNSLEGSFCIEAAEDALRWSCPEIFKHGSRIAVHEQLIRRAVGILWHSGEHGLQRSCAGQRVHIQRLWRSVKYEEIYLEGYSNGLEAELNMPVLPILQ